jgi:hypothetical protein
MIKHITNLKTNWECQQMFDVDNNVDLIIARTSNYHYAPGISSRTLLIKHGLKITKDYGVLLLAWEILEQPSNEEMIIKLKIKI